MTVGYPGLHTMHHYKFLPHMITSGDVMPPASSLATMKHAIFVIQKAVRNLNPGQMTIATACIDIASPMDLAG